MAARSTIKPELLDERLAGKDPKTVFESDGLLDELKKALAERILNAEIDHHLDKETNLHYNYFRDYDPAIGRYVQSDPVGLEGGLNTYAYVGNNPLSFTDPTGENPATAVGAGIGTLVIPGPGTVAGAVIGTAVGVGIWWMASSVGGAASSSGNCPPDDPCDTKLSKREIKKLQKLELMCMRKKKVSEVHQLILISINARTEILLSNGRVGEILLRELD